MIAVQKKHDFSVPALGRATVHSPIFYSTTKGDSLANYVRDDEFILYQIDVDETHDGNNNRDAGCIQKAGPREHIYFAPKHVHAGIVSCGGLCPGLNDVIRAITRCLWYRYGVRRITGIEYGYQGFLAESGGETRPLQPDVINDIHKIGGTILGSARGGGDRVEDIVDAIERLNLNILFPIGGDGTQKGALAIAEEIERRNLKIGVVGIPKTIDNDLSLMERSFGFQTAVAKATEAVRSAYAEASSVRNGIGLVKVMGRHSGFIAAHTAIASHEIDFALVPEVPFALDGPHGLMDHLEKRLAEKGFAVIVVAEGAGQELFTHKEQRDASGNIILGDIGRLLKERIEGHFRATDSPCYMKYIDPSYMIRSAVALPSDSFFCARLANNAVHAAMAGKTKIVVGLVHNVFVHLPIGLTVSVTNRIDPESSLWRDVIEATQQPLRIHDT